MRRLLYEDEYMKLDAGLLGGIALTMKKRGTRRKLTAGERRWILDAIETAKNNGVPIKPGVPALDRFFEHIGDGFILGSPRWQMVFLSQSGVQAGEAIANEFREDRGLQC